MDPQTPELVDLNISPERHIAALPGVGHERGRRVIEYREEHGGFNQVDDLLNIDGFDSDLVEGLRSRLLIGGRQAA